MFTMKYLVAENDEPCNDPWKMGNGNRKACLSKKNTFTNGLNMNML